MVIPCGSMGCGSLAKVEAIATVLRAGGFDWLRPG
jgi:hypothetical protein